MILNDFRRLTNGGSFRLGLLILLPEAVEGARAVRVTQGASAVSLAHVPVADVDGAVGVRLCARTVRLVVFEFALVTRVVRGNQNTLSFPDTVHEETIVYRSIAANLSAAPMTVPLKPLAQVEARAVESSQNTLAVTIASS